MRVTLHFIMELDMKSILRCLDTAVRWMSVVVIQEDVCRSAICHRAALDQIAFKYIVHGL